MSTAMMEASSCFSARTRKSSFSKSDIQIHIDNHFKTKTYTSLSPLSGAVNITTKRHVQFESVDIMLIGCSKISTVGCDTIHESTHTFLEMVMPISESTYPVTRVLHPGRAFRIPFNFVLPGFLPLGACAHRVASDQVRGEHLRMPPSLGFSPSDSWKKDDLAPRMVNIQYYIKARVWQKSGSRLVRVMEAIQPIQVLPASAEDAPLSITENDGLYRMSRTRTMRKSLVCAKLGTLVVSGEQPRPILLRPDGQISVNTNVQLDVKFEPVSADVQPPNITRVSSKIRAHTYFAAQSISDFPNLRNCRQTSTPDRRGVYSTSVSLPCEPPERVIWLATYVPRDSDRDSGYCSGIDDDDDDDDDDEKDKERSLQRGKPSMIGNFRWPSKQTPRIVDQPLHQPAYYRTTVQVPVTIPTEKKLFIPSFHSCIASRVYTLDICLTAAYGPTSRVTFSLRLPLQIAVEASGLQKIANDELPSFAVAIGEADADESLRSSLSGVSQAASRDTSLLPVYGVGQ